MCIRDSQYIDTTRKAVDCATTLLLTFYIMKLYSRLFVVYCQNCPKDDKFRYFIPIFKKIRGSVDGSLESPCRVLVKCNWTSFFNSLLSGGGRSVRAKISGEGVIPGEYFLVSTKLDRFCYLTVQTAPCYVPSFWHNIGVWRMDRQTDRRNCGS